MNRRGALLLIALLPVAVGAVALWVGIVSFVLGMVLSTVGEEKTLEEGREAGATGWMVKPFEPEELLSVIGQLL